MLLLGAAVACPADDGSGGEESSGDETAGEGRETASGGRQSSASKASRPDDDASPGAAGEAVERAKAAGEDKVPITRECRVPPPPPSGALREHRGVRYASPGGRALHYDLAMPKQDGPHPVVVLIHGGGWRAGERAHMHREMRMLASLGFAAATLDYRLTTGSNGTFPEAVSDVRCAVRHLRAHAERYGLEADRMAAVGTSAGGHLAALLATAPENAGLDGRCPVQDVSPAVQAAVLYFTPFDLRDEAPYKKGTRRVVARFLGARPSEAPQRAALASPMTHLDGSDPPMLLVHGTADPTVDVRQSRRMYRALREKGVSATYVELAGEGHAFPLLGGRSGLRPATCTTLAFLGRVL